MCIFGTAATALNVTNASENNSIFLGDNLQQKVEVFTDPETAPPLVGVDSATLAPFSQDSEFSVEVFPWVIVSLQSPRDVGMYSSLALDSAYSPHITCYDATNGDLSYFHKQGTSWYESIVDSDGDSGKYSSLALDSSDYPHISYYDATNKALEYRYQQGSSWYGSTLLDPADRDVGKYSSLSLYNPEGTYITVSYQDSTNLGLREHRPGYTTTSYWDLGGATTGLYTSQATYSDGYARVSFYDATNGELRFLKEKYASWKPYPYIDYEFSTVDSTGNVGLYTSLALDSSGNPHISYYDNTNGNLKYAKNMGSGWQISTVDSTGNVGLYTSLALGGSGNPRISYYDKTNGNLKYAKWVGSEWQISTVDSTGNVGLYTSLALDGSGNPCISYYDKTNGNLKYAWFKEGVMVTVPNGGEKWKRGTTQTIRWKYAGNPGADVRIQLLKSGVVKKVITKSTSIGTGGTGSFNWKISASQALGNDYKIRIISNSDTTKRDMSNKVFRIIA